LVFDFRKKKNANKKCMCQKWFTKFVDDYIWWFSFDRKWTETLLHTISTH